jgi:hypothetical protein
MTSFPSFASVDLPQAASQPPQSKSVFIRTTILKSFVFLRKFLPRESAKNTKRKSYVSAVFAFFCGYHLWLRLLPR